MLRLLAALVVTLFLESSSVNSFSSTSPPPSSPLGIIAARSLALPARKRSCQHRPVPLSSTKSAAVAEEEDMSSCLEVLNRAAETRREDSDAVVTALLSLERLSRGAARDDPTFASDMKKNLTGDWRLIFTTGTAKTQKRRGGRRINYFPLKAIQSFDTESDPMTIENGIYVGDFPLIRFSGQMDFDERKCRLEFDFDRVLVLNFFDVALGKGEAGKIGAASGLGSEGRTNAAEKKEKEKDKAAFFNWISADDRIATARGGGGGLALWKRVKE